MMDKPNTVYGVHVADWDRTSDTGKMLAMARHIDSLNRDINRRQAKIKRLTDRGIEDMKHEIEDLKCEIITQEHMLEAVRTNMKELVRENADLYHAIRGHEQALVDGDRIELPIERYRELCRKEQELDNG